VRVDIQYSNWEEAVGQPHASTPHRCVVVTGRNYWNTFDCKVRQSFVCQSWWIYTYTKLYC